MKNSFNIVEFYQKLYSRLNLKELGVKFKESSPCGNKNNKYLAVYYFGYSYIRMYFTKENILEVYITVERYGPNQRNIFLEFTEEELMNEKTIDLLECIIKLISYSTVCPEYYCFESDFLYIVVCNNKNSKVKFPVSLEKLKNVDCGYWRYYQVLLWEIQNIKEDPNMWIDFVNSEYFRIFEELYGTYSFKKIKEVIESSSLPKYIKNKVIKFAKK